jgi:methyl-accepting chemotaxis protein
VELQSYADNLSKGLEEFERSLAFLEEQRRLDARRISDTSGEIGDVAKRVEGQQAKLDLLEELSRRNERTIAELAGLLNEFKQQRVAWSEQQALADQKRENVMNDMLRRMEMFAEDMENFAKQVEGWSGTHREMKKLIQDFERLADRVDRRVNEVSEVQRLSEERFRTEWEEFQGEDQKRWRQFTLTNEEAWRENEKALGEIRILLTQFSERAERQREHIKYVSEVQQGILNMLSENAQALREQAEDRRGSLPAMT